MKHPSHTKVLIGTTMAIVVMIMTMFGTLGYLVYGEDIKGSITLNLRGDTTGTVM
jgi:amino acid permease